MLRRTTGEKAREQKDRAQRDAQNQEHAGSSYHVPAPEEVAVDEELSGLPWGGPNLRYVVAKGHESHESSSQQGSRKASDYVPEDTQFLTPYGGGYQQPSTWDAGNSSGGEERYYNDSPYYFDYDTSGGNSNQ